MEFCIRWQLNQYGNNFFQFLELLKCIVAAEQNGNVTS
jgi:hypothetical protein